MISVIVIENYRQKYEMFNAYNEERFIMKQNWYEDQTAIGRSID